MKSRSMSLFTKSIYAFLIGMSAIGSSTAADSRLTQSDILNIEEQRLTQTPVELIEQSMPKLNYYNDNAYLDRIHKLAYTFPIALINDGQKVELVDNSQWAVHYLQRRQVNAWRQSDTLFIKPKSSCFSMYPYILYNRTTYEAVEVQFVSMPQYYGAYRQKIAKIDPYNRLIQLDDAERTVWQISFSDAGFNFWAEGDYIVVGVNNDWRIASYPHILINTTIDGAPYCEANFYGYGI